MAVHALVLGLLWPKPHAPSLPKHQLLQARLIPSAATEAAASRAPKPFAAAPVSPSTPEPASSASIATQAAAHAAEVAVWPRERPRAAMPQQQARAPEPLPEEPPPPAPVKDQAVARPAADTAAAAATTESHLPGASLDALPKPLTEVRPVYPPGAGNRSGVVTLDLLINAYGVVEGVQVIDASTPGVFDASAVAAFLVTRFSPGMRSGRPVLTRLRVEVQYAAGGTGIAVSGAGGPGP
ncbi:MAG: hypothetical protein DI563_05845 [Variovorax paradoxus]|uniref:TonB C-terminal domain-containing protein n=1 Tax=Variovorax paradoxus TaxID=34073 RepID=A0A2W5QIG6_VARPD|nr:MAG: hypothetical protein DI563_05845 [Variovorax paradoxus]